MSTTTLTHEALRKISKQCIVSENPKEKAASLCYIIKDFENALKVFASVDRKSLEAANPPGFENKVEDIEPFSRTPYKVFWDNRFIKEITFEEELEKMNPQFTSWLSKKQKIDTEAYVKKHFPKVMLFALFIFCLLLVTECAKI